LEAKAMHILYVEDDLVMQAELVRLLRGQDHEVVAVSNAFEALEHLRTHRPDVLLCDYKLGAGPSGLSLVDQVRLRFPACTIVMVSSYVSNETLTRAMQFGADDFVAKPVDNEILIERVWAAFARRQSWFPRIDLPASNLGPLVLDTAGQTASWQGEPINLTATEYGVLAQLVTSPGQVIPFAALWVAAKGEQISHSEAGRLLKPHIASLRAKLEPDNGQPSPIQNVRGRGYKWTLAQEA
jgi:DNA-binding response OmpR family regulator